MPRWLSLFLVTLLLSACCAENGKTDAKPGEPKRAEGKVVLHEMLRHQKSVDVPGTELTVQVLRAAMQHAKDNHYLSVRLQVSLEGQTKVLQLWDRDPQVWKGFRFTLDYDGFAWGKQDVKVKVERLRQP